MNRKAKQLRLFSGKMRSYKAAAIDWQEVAEPPPPNLSVVLFISI
jgi:uncharacterized coiled-coil protein SlyX